MSDVSNNASKDTFGMDGDDWKRLIRAIGAPEEDEFGLVPDCRCTPILGPEFCNDPPAAPRELAKKWANKMKIGDSLFGDDPRLAQLAQYVAVSRDEDIPRLAIGREFANYELPSDASSSDPRMFLADLPMPLYITTYYDDLMYQALKRNRMRKPRQEYCRWKQSLDAEPSIFDDGFMPDAGNPVVFHLYGQASIPQSLVLTDHDYLDCLAHISQERTRIPGPIGKALSSSYLLFLGYRFFDLEFMVLLRMLSKYLDQNPVSKNNVHISVQFLDQTSSGEKDKAEDYLRSYFRTLSMTVCWATCESFMFELQRRWKDAVHVH